MVALSLNIAKTTVNTIWSDRDKIKRAFDEASVISRKRLRAAEFDDVENALLKWFNVARSQNVPISGQILREKAATFAKKMHHDSFQCCSATCMGRAVAMMLRLTCLPSNNLSYSRVEI